jgi:4-hydroxy-2-oxoheptanedioate aldolase
MYVNTAKQKMEEGGTAFGYQLGLGSPVVAELLARTGIDFLLVETQHGTWGHDSIIAAFMGITGGSAVPMARVLKSDYGLVGRLLDQGCMGIVVPMIDTPEQAKEVVDFCRLPPAGLRSWGMGRARVFGDDYPLWASEQVFVAVQIESALAVKNAEAIMATPGIDGCWVGPNDMALSMGIHPRDIPNSDEHRRALEQVVVACKNTGTIPGISCPTPEEGKAKADMGFRFVTAGNDTGFLLAGARAGLKVLGLA